VKGDQVEEIERLRMALDGSGAAFKSLARTVARLEAEAKNERHRLIEQAAIRLLPVLTAAKMHGAPILDGTGTATRLAADLADNLDEYFERGIYAPQKGAKE